MATDLGQSHGRELFVFVRLGQSVLIVRSTKQ